jgi:adenylosuccinate synthase
MPDKTVSEILLPGDPTDLEQQSELTHLLEEMQPGYTQIQAKAEYLTQISQALAAPVVITSTGPTAREKKYTPPPGSPAIFGIM